MQVLRVVHVIVAVAPFTSLRSVALNEVVYGFASAECALTNTKRQ